MRRFPSKKSPDPGGRRLGALLSGGELPVGRAQSHLQIGGTRELGQDVRPRRRPLTLGSLYVQAPVRHPVERGLLREPLLPAPPCPLAHLFGFVGPAEVTASPLLVGALLFALADMYLLYRYTEFVNADLGSTALAALAVDCLNDIYTTIAALVGVFGVFLNVPILDPIAGALVSLLVVYQGIEIGRENVTYLVGGAPPSGDRERVVAALRDNPAVEGVHDLTVFYDGTDLEVEVHVEVDGEMTLREAHDVETELVTSLRTLEDVGDVHVHLDPSGLGEWKDAPDGPGAARE